MNRLYARLVLWMIRPALDNFSAEQRGEMRKRAADRLKVLDRLDSAERVGASIGLRAGFEPLN
jgi:hypothetical protein